MSQYFTNDESLKSKLMNIIYKYEDTTINFKSDLGVFSKSKIDYASNLLVSTYFKYGRKDISALDVGCGFGFIGITLSKFMNINFDMIDVNNRAIHLTDINIKNNKVNCKVFNSDIYESIIKKYDLIITNPPIRAGKKIYMTILKDAANFLNDDGELWFVMSKDAGAKTVIKELESIYNVDVLCKSKGFFVIICKNR